MWNLGAMISAVALVAAMQSPAPQQLTIPGIKIEKAPPLQNPLPTVGLVTQGTYKNPSIGIEITPAENLRLEDPQIKGTPGTIPLLITISASEIGVPTGLPRNLMIFYADGLALYPAVKSTIDDYVKSIIRHNEADGYKTVESQTQNQISGIPVERANFVKGDVHETVLITSHGAYMFVFIFAGLDLEVINKSIAATKVKLSAVVPDYR